MTAKEYLNQAFHLDQRINSKLDMMATLKEMSGYADGDQCGHRSADRQEAGDHAHDLRGGKSGIPDTAGAQIHLLSQLGGDR